VNIKPDGKSRIDRSTNRRLLAFTLIELLVVIAIIAVLAALLLPLLRFVQENSRTSKCSSNLRQIGAAMLMFASDHSDCFPESGSTIPWGQTNGQSPYGSGQKAWMYQIAPYAGGTGNDPQYAQGASIFTCPSSSLVNTFDKYYSYFNGAHAAMAQTGGFGPVSLRSISNPAEYILSGDITTWGNQPGNADADKDNYLQNPTQRQANFHNGAVNLLFADGHVATIQWNSALSSSGDGGYYDKSRMTTVYLGTGYSYLYYYGQQ
jgi:prepilin-type processing-associated H-X9-DG protein/prepilin-type N-terminal cleavage/methylation domain-containing protein